MESAPLVISTGVGAADEAYALGGGGGGGCGGGGDDGCEGFSAAAEIGAPRSNQAAVMVSRPGGDGRRAPARKRSRLNKDTASSSSSSSSSPSSRQLPGGIRLRSRRRGTMAPRRAVGGEEGCDDLALPLGMSFAAIIAQVLDRKNVSRKGLSVDRLSKICTSAVEESIQNIYGDRFDCFMRNFEKSFGSTLKTLRLINETPISKEANRSISEMPVEQESAIWNSFINNSCEAPRTPETPTAIEEFQEKPQLNNQLILHGHINQQLTHGSQIVTGPGFNQSIASTFEKSVMEQTRSNDLKAVEIGLIMKKLQLKQSQLALNSYANLLEKIKITMGISRASFKEEKLRNQMQDTRNVELVRTCIDLLVAGLVILLSFLAYGAYIYSFQRIAEATSSCTSIVGDSGSWWIPKPVSTFNSSWHMLRCYAQVLSRMLFGLLMILVMAYSMFQRSAASGPSMPVTFILLLLGGACGFAGKLCVDSLGGNGYHWLLLWEALCLVHFIINIFPSTLYNVLYGPIVVSQGAKASVVPYWVRRYTFFAILLLVLPTMAGLLPFASVYEWKGHFAEKIVGA